MALGEVKKKSNLSSIISGYVINFKLIFVQTYSNWNRIVKIRLKLFKLDQTSPNWIKLVQIGSNLLILAQTSPNQSRLIQLELDLSKLLQMFIKCQNWIIFVKIISNLSDLDFKRFWLDSSKFDQKD